MSDDNIVNFGQIKGGKTGENDIPENDYVILDIDGTEFYANGFMIFTPHHVAIMSDIEGKGAVPVLVIPLIRVRSAELYEDPAS